VSLYPLMDLECSVHMELPVHALLPGAEVGGRLGHGDYLWPVDLVGVSNGHNYRRAFVGTFFSQSVRSPIREAIKKPGSTIEAQGLAYLSVPRARQIVLLGTA
jgi:hypothetical protein